MPAKQTQVSRNTTAMAMAMDAANRYAMMVSPATPATTTNSKTTSLTAMPMQATSGSSAIVISVSTSSSTSGSNGSAAAKSASTTTAAVKDGDLAMAALLDSLGHSLGSALQAQMDKALKGTAAT
ncbi:hypothetical protein [Undibacterium sp.]|uniref:hypothetical protein n=1 Tax=Undibacterium sp. TaxID=1914977 RepID=UPI002731D5CC|nr:hypothetical protein [Undibacterium sp.]MDP1977203.1 hypothetical protein [Undibacterium sp.]